MSASAREAFGSIGLVPTHVDDVPGAPALRDCAPRARNLADCVLIYGVAAILIQRVAQHPTLQGKRLTPHVLRHTAAMTLLQAGVDSAVIALWLGHADVRSTNVYLHADLTIKQRALERAAPATSPPGRYRPPDQLLALLESL